MIWIAWSWVAENWREWMPFGVGLLGFVATVFVGRRVLAWRRKRKLEAIKRGPDNSGIWFHAWGPDGVVGFDTNGNRIAPSSPYTRADWIRDALSGEVSLEQLMDRWAKIERDESEDTVADETPVKLDDWVTLQTFANGDKMQQSRDGRYMRRVTNGATAGPGPTTYLFRTENLAPAVTFQVEVAPAEPKTETCTYCKAEYPAPVSSHHDLDECRELQELAKAPKFRAGQWVRSKINGLLFRVESVNGRVVQCGGTSGSSVASDDVLEPAVPRKGEWWKSKVSGYSKLVQTNDGVSPDYWEPVNFGRG